MALDRPQTLKTVGVLMLAVIFAPDTGSAQPEDALLQTIERIEAQGQNGSQSPELIAPLQTLALRYEENGNHALATATIERALDVTRLNFGLHSLEQVPLIQQVIDSEKARDNHAAVWALEQELLTLVQRHPDDLRTVPILREIADLRMDIIDRYIAGDYPPEIVLGCYYRSRTAIFGSCSSGSQSIVQRGILLDAWEYYEDAIGVLVRNRLYSSEELRELEIQLLRYNYVYGDVLLSPVPHAPSSRYERGKARLRRLVYYGIVNAEPSSQLDALVQLADWELIYSNHALATDGYEQAYDRLVQEGAPQESIAQMFSPDLPIALPAYMPNPLVSEQTPQSTGFVDVVFDITKYGRSEHVEILDTTTNATRSAREEIVLAIEQRTFRPNLIDGRLAERPRVMVRYYVNE